MLKFGIVCFALSDWEFDTSHDASYCFAFTDIAFTDHFQTTQFEMGDTISQYQHVYLLRQACILQYSHRLGTLREIFMQYSTL